MDGQIFISYRRDDSSSAAGRIYDRLDSHFSANRIFIDVDNLDLGVDFAEEIEKNVGSCDVLIAVIGKHWLISCDEEGRRRLDNPEDFVRIEIATALKRGVRVIPVLIDGASMPRPSDLPDDLRPLLRRNALEVSHTSFKSDCARLIGALERALETARADGRERERLEAERQEKERLEAERRENKRLEAEQLERNEKKRPEVERHQRGQNDRLEAERQKEKRQAEQREQDERLEAQPHREERELPREVAVTVPPQKEKAPLRQTPKDRRFLAACAGVAILVALIVVLSQRETKSPSVPSNREPPATVAHTPAPAMQAPATPAMQDEGKVASGTAQALVGHWRNTRIIFESPEDEHLVLHSDGTAEKWTVTASGSGNTIAGTWSAEGDTLTLLFEGMFGGKRETLPFTFYEGSLVFPNTPNQRKFWERIE